MVILRRCIDLLRNYRLGRNFLDDTNCEHLNNIELFSFLDCSQNFPVDGQPSFNTYNVYNMATECPAMDASIESANLVGERPTMRCSIPDCPQDRVFPTESALRKHEEKHSKPYLCQVPNCKHPRFGDKGGLDRHNREVHGSQTYCCPIPTCKRHVRGFPRKHNLFEHQKRCHSGVTLPLIPRQQSYSSDSRGGVREGDEESSSPDMIAMDVGRNSGGRLREELERLYKLRAEIDGDIDALKRTLGILGESSP